MVQGNLDNFKKKKTNLKHKQKVCLHRIVQEYQHISEHYFRNFRQKLIINSLTWSTPKENKGRLQTNQKRTKFGLLPKGGGGVVRSFVSFII